MPNLRPTKRLDWRYLSFWLVFLAVAFSITLVFVIRTNLNTHVREGITSVEPQRIKTDKERIAEERYNQDIPPDFKIEGGKFTLSNETGVIKLTIYCDKLINIKGDATLSELGAVFETPKGQSVALIAKNLDYSFKNEVLNINGDITGMFPLSGQRFTAKNLIWDQNSNLISLKKAELDQLGINATSNEMVYNLDSQEIDLNSGITAQF